MLKNEDKWKLLANYKHHTIKQIYTTAISKQCESIEKYQLKNAYIVYYFQDA